MKKLGILIVLVLAVLFGLKACQPQIGERMFKRMVHKRLNTPPALASLPDGLHAVLVGTGSPLADPSRAGPCTVIIAGKKVFVVDVGGGAVRNFGPTGVPAGMVDRVFLTHFHSDHIDGLGELMLQRWINRASQTPLPVYGPDGVEQIIDGLNMTYAQDGVYRTAHHGEQIAPPSGFGGEANPFTVGTPTVIYENGDLKVTAFPVDHEPVFPAVGYRFDYKGRSISITGDTAPGSKLASPIKGSDLLISEALNRDMVKIMEDAAGGAGAKGMAKIMADIQDYHISPVEAAQLAEETDADMLVLTHIVPIVPVKYLQGYFMKGAADKFSGKTVMGEDGMMVSLPAGSDTIETN